ncbi:hypothetical protein [Pyxidicoccus trucidator]|uniref:hypothetical protein n=1 Tax=Pyxidicoccus trucidator TaxID=2709662 RepID=UPI0013D9C2BA|nr:hypothetical protein [Pyxidicoccus trucidator]
MAPEGNRQRSWWPWGCILLVAVPCCGSVGLMQRRFNDGKDFCRTITVGEPLGAVLSRADQSGLFLATRKSDISDPRTRFLRQELAPLCEFVCIVHHDGARVTAHRGSLAGLCS